MTQDVAARDPLVDKHALDTYPFLLSYSKGSAQPGKNNGKLKPDVTTVTL
jgi:hypothetical protein